MIDINAPFPTKNVLHKWFSVAYSVKYTQTDLAFSNLKHLFPEQGNVVLLLRHISQCASAERIPAQVGDGALLDNVLIVIRHDGGRL